jgi:hypothetical protein
MLRSCISKERGVKILKFSQCFDELETGCDPFVGQVLVVGQTRLRIHSGLCSSRRES